LYYSTISIPVKVATAPATATATAPATAPAPATAAARTSRTTNSNRDDNVADTTSDCEYNKLSFVKADGALSVGKNTYILNHRLSLVSYTTKSRSTRVNHNRFGRRNTVPR
jgi:hypothetical protein